MLHGLSAKSIIPALTAILIVLCVGLAINRFRQEVDFAGVREHPVNEVSNPGGFHTGFYAPAEFDRLDGLAKEVRNAETLLDRPIDIASLYVAWGPDSIDRFPCESLMKLIADGSIPMITWEPWTSTFPWTHEQALPLSRNEGIFRNIADGKFDHYITDFTGKLRDLDAPVFLRFGHEMDNPLYPWSEGGTVASKDFIEAWKRIVSLCRKEGASKITFVYNPWRGAAMDKYYPGDDYVDWIGLTLLNYGKASRDGRWHSFDSLYAEFHPYAEHYKKPVMLAEFGSTAYGGNAASWLADAFKMIEASYPQIRAVVLFHSAEDKNWATAWRPTPCAKGIDWSILHDPEARAEVAKGFELLQLKFPGHGQPREDGTR